MHPWTFLAPPSLEYLSGNLFPFSAHARLKYASPLSSMLQFNFTLPLTFGEELCPAVKREG